jgi:SAM-dependent methyltransferase
MTSDYSEIYNHKMMQNSDGKDNLNAHQIKFGDALAAICYAHDIEYEAIKQHWPQYGNERMVMKGVTVQHQIDFVKQHAKRTPKNILEIGAGRGEVTQFLAHMGYNVTAVEPGVDYAELFAYTNHMLFPKEKLNYQVHNKPLHLCDIDYSKYDTILMVESLEHILAEHFDPEWEKIKATFKGYFIVVNWKKYHPIAVGQYARKEVHCRLVNDALYDSFCEGHTTKVRDASHLCVEL